ncbi:hypothetical protein P7C71_g3316, partial [Lecanoromycetidae sp. Uapishka_2]
MEDALKIIKESVPPSYANSKQSVFLNVDALPTEVLEKLLHYLRQPGSGLAKPPAQPPKPAHCSKCLELASSMYQNKSRPINIADFERDKDIAATVLKHKAEAPSKPSINYQQGLNLANNLLLLLKEADSEDLFTKATHHFESLRLVYEANCQAAISAGDIMTKAQKSDMKVFKQRLKCEQLLKKQETAHSIHVKHIAALRGQIEAAGSVGGGADYLFAMLLRLDIEVDRLPAMITSVTETSEKLAVWERRANRRKSRFAGLMTEMHDRHDECQKLYEEGGKIQVRLDAMEKNLDFLAGKKMLRGRYKEGKWYDPSCDEAVEVCSTLVVLPK